MQFAELNGINTHFQVIGAPEGKPVLVFVNGLGTDQRIWRDVVMRFVGDAALVTYDMRGHGLTDLGAANGSLSQLCDDLAALIEHLRQANVILVGLSIGGLIAQDLAARRPELVRALVLANTATRIGTERLWHERIEAVERGGIEALADATMERWFSTSFRVESAAELQGYRTMLVRQSQAGYLNGSRVLKHADLVTSSAALSRPTLCLGGEEDGSTPPDVVAAMAEIIPHARYEMIASCGHIPCIEQPETMSDMINAFMDQFGLWGAGGV